ncbi:lipopolysaccharide biosynthesis protein [Lacticaseibacillus suilingensis]
MNSSVAASLYIGRTIIGFILRSFFIHTLGSEYLGLNGLFTNVLSFLSLAELGIGTSIIYELYRPLAEHDDSAVHALLNLYRKAYDLIGLVVGIAGLCLIPVLHYFVNSNSVIPHLYSYYVLFLANSVFSYFFTYKRSLLNADQHNYITIINDFLFYLGTSGLQIMALVFFKSYYGYLLIQIGMTILSNFSISHIVSLRYRKIFSVVAGEVSNSTKAQLKRNVIGNISSQIGSIVVFGSDNLLISSFVGLTAVGIYSNYTMITNAVKGVMQQATGSLVSSIGNLIVDVSSSHAYKIFRKYLFINSSASFFASIGVYTFINPFINYWLGPKYLLSKTTVLLMSIYLLITMYQGSVRTFISAYGLFWQQRYKPVIEAIMNLVVSLILLIHFRLGIDAVLVGTISSFLFINTWFEPYLVFKFGFRRNAKEYIFETLWSIFSYLLTIGIMAGYQLVFVPKGFVQLAVYVVLGGFLITIMFFILFYRNPEFSRFFKEFFKRLKI